MTHFKINISFFISKADTQSSDINGNPKEGKMSNLPFNV